MHLLREGVCASQTDTPKYTRNEACLSKLIN
jgi:hypothetical protein